MEKLKNIKRIPVRVVFIITSLSTGGAQMMLYKVLSGMNREHFMPEVISLIGSPSDPNSLAERYRYLGIPLRFFNFLNSSTFPFQFVSLARHLRHCQPHLVSTWMYHADLIGGLSAFFAGKIPVVWNIRHSDLDWKQDKKSTLLVAAICARLSKYLPENIICCARRAQETHVAMGYDRGKMVVIPNGFDTNEFWPDSFVREEARRDLGLADDILAIGLISRFHPHKGHGTFIKAAKIFTSKYPMVRFILSGSGISWENKELADPIQQNGLREYFQLLDHRSDMPRLYPALDVVTSASICEGFPNVIGEAMSCGVPCVVTDVGDSAWIIENTGRVVPPNSPEQLAEAWGGMARLGAEGRKRLGDEARHRIVQNFSLSSIVQKYETLFKVIANTGQEDNT